MALPILPLALGAGLIALLALTSSKSSGSSAPGGVPPTPAPPPTPGVAPMPPALKAQFDDLLQNGVNADGLDTVAGELEKFGFLNEAATLRARANQLRTAAASRPQVASPQPAPAAAPTPTPVFVPGVLSDAEAAAKAAAAAASALRIPLTPPPPPEPAAIAPQARVTTNDPPPGGDLIMRTSPDDSAPQVPGGGAEKDGLVFIIIDKATPDGVWSQIEWPGGSRRPAATGFAKKKFLVPVPPSPRTSGMVVGAVGQRYAKCVAPAGCRLRFAPSTEAQFRAMVENGATVQVLSHMQGTKADYGSPGPGGWACVKYKHLQGWVPSEWLSAA